MSLLNLEQIEDGVVKYAVETIGQLLAKDKNKRPFVIIENPSDNSNDKGLKPDMPFVSVRSIGVTTPYGFLLDVFVDEQGRTCYRIPFKVQIRVTATGKNSFSIISDFKQRLEISSLRARLTEYTGGAILVDSGQMPQNFDMLQTDYEPSTPLILELAVDSILVDYDSGVIERVIADGVLHYGEGDTQAVAIHLDEHTQDYRE
ncbi:hypothetical protein ErPhphiEa104_gp055 [Erwinia phage phiEa104]|uniref:Phage neck terminator protein gp12-like domain-containing protein n=7 Tax=Caudoviricetes TaxID=2731619 RepID=A0A6B9RGM6_9CAUD|nr:hypothetical protein Ea21-4_gp56 [Erwinia phage phiEa21-4]YP_004327030.1 hypothetical protein ErPhphiEa104_gp055 [Erwinia phage phiEa104]AYD79585.1 hypothetical protein LINGLNFE_00077 [Enterobacter phage phi63_307]QEG07706.1 hypothetical protein [Salmonella phage SE5]QGF21788.1 hypothetical protein [Salmonella phage ST-3]QHI00600.1 hypothetical protein [Salmonella phage vB_SenM_SB18]WJN64960.1 hypothetical protein Erwinia_phage_Tian_00045 [Erwinia phage Tian]